MVTKEKVAECMRDDFFNHLSDAIGELSGAIQIAELLGDPEMAEHRIRVGQRRMLRDDLLDAADAVSKAMTSGLAPKPIRLLDISNELMSDVRIASRPSDPRAFQAMARALTEFKEELDMKRIDHAFKCITEG